MDVPVVTPGAAGATHEQRLTRAPLLGSRRPCSSRACPVCSPWSPNAKPLIRSGPRRRHQKSQVQGHPWSNGSARQDRREVEASWPGPLPPAMPQRHEACDQWEGSTRASASGCWRRNRRSSAARRQVSRNRGMSMPKVCSNSAITPLVWPSPQARIAGPRP